MAKPEPEIHQIQKFIALTANGPSSLREQGKGIPKIEMCYNQTAT